MKKIVCSLLGHKYRVKKYFSASTQQLECSRCKQLFGINHSTQSLIKWDFELETLHREIYPNSYK